MTKMIQDKISIPKLPDPGDIKPISQVSSYELYVAIENVLI
jgi:hypothetical protein